jgi:hypothetical protein
MAETAPRLGIVVPYRDRAAHLRAFLPAIGAYLAAHAPEIPARVLVVEQAPGAPFNQGLLQNAGFLMLREEIDYLCLHDVDTLPERADFSWPERPAMLVAEGLPHDAALTRILLSGAVLLQKAGGSRMLICGSGCCGAAWRMRIAAARAGCYRMFMAGGMKMARRRRTMTATRNYSLSGGSTRWMAVTGARRRRWTGAGMG